MVCGNVWWCSVEGGSVRMRMVVCGGVLWCIVVCISVVVCGIVWCSVVMCGVCGGVSFPACVSDAVAMRLCSQTLHRLMRK